MSRPLQYWLPLFAYCGVIFFLSSSVNPLPRPSVFLIDKLLHMAEYSLLGFLMARAIFSLNLQYSHRSLFVLAIVLSTLYGLSDEFHQSFTAGRIASGADIIADGLGSAIGAFSYLKIVLSRT